MKEINYKEMKFNPFNLIGGEWMLVTAGNEQSGCNTMTASWGHLGCLWGHNDPTAVIYLRPSRYTKKFVDEEPYFTLCVMDKSFKKQMAYLGSVSGLWLASQETKGIIMTTMNRPNPNKVFPNPNLPRLCFIKNVVKNPRIIIGDYTYYDDIDGADQFEKHVTHFYDFIGDKLIIGKFCAIAKGVEFVMNGANHRMDCITTYPFYIMGGDWGSAIAPVKDELPLKGDTIVGNDVWIGQNVTIMPGVHIGDGAIIGTNSVVAKDIPPYAIAVGNPCRVVRKRFDDELIEILLKLRWWDKSIEEIENLMPILSCSDLEKVKEELKTRL